jgi:PII-like signaling protein
VTDALKLTVYHGERDRIGGAFLAERLGAIFARHELRAGIVLRGATGFGVKHRLRTDRLLTLSEDLPVVTVGVDVPAKVEGALEDVSALGFRGLVTLERARFDLHRAEVKLTAYLGRGTDHRAVVAAL